MHIWKKLLFISLLFSLSFPLFAQQRKPKYVDSATTMVWTGANFSYQFPGGDLAKIFKSNMNIGTGLTVKTASNWTWNLNFNYYFAAKVKNPEDVIGIMLTKEGYVIDGNGSIGNLEMDGRYWSLTTGFGKIFPVNQWKNSGIWLRADFGYFEHKIHFKNPEDVMPQLIGNYQKGYDQLSGGFMMSQFIGFIFIGKKRAASAYAGFEISEAWTKSRRNYNFNLGKKDTDGKFSLLFGIKIGWVIPLYEKKTEQTLYYR